MSRHAQDFIDDARLEKLAGAADLVDVGHLREVIAKSLGKEALSVEETAVLLHTRDRELREEVLGAARELKQRVYGNRIVLFAPLYIGNMCVNDCSYCGFQRKNKHAVRRTLGTEEIREQVVAMENQGHKRLIVVFGEHPRYDADFIATCIRDIYDTRSGRGEIRRVNVNAAPFDHAGFATIKAAGIGTYQIFMETYHHKVYAAVHPAGTPKGDYLWRLDALSRAFEVGQDDLGIGALFGLADWRFDVLGLVSHAVFLKDRYGCGPHTISFPRLRPASGATVAGQGLVSDEDFKFLIAVLRLAVPYTGLILTARETADLRRAAMEMGVSQIDAGSCIELGGYTEQTCGQRMEREQFSLGDLRSLDTVIRELTEQGHVPSFCTACYRLGRTGEHFMEFAIPGFIKRFCTPNALTTFMEYLVDYASPATAKSGLAQIKVELEKLEDSPMKQKLLERLELISTTDQRDMVF
ncbi:MAG: [FeFe] hydrogenase H-cluster radical SAM maturase HydG [Polyangia bacterium]